MDVVDRCPMVGLDQRALASTFTSTANVANDGGTRCTSANLLGSSPSASIGKVFVLRAGAGSCSNPKFQFWLQYPGSSWKVAQKFSLASSWTWDTSKLLAGSYNIVVWANQNGESPAHAEAWALTTVTLSVGPACTAAGLSADKASPQQSGTIITFTGTATTCPFPEYLFYVQATGGPWILGRGYGSAMYVWNTAGNGATTYNVDVWVREKGSAASQQAFLLMPYTLSSPLACAAANLIPDKASPQPSGTTVTFTATSTTCSQPEYLFYVQATGGPWILGWGYGSATYVWKTTGNGATTYNVDVWVRQNGSKVSQQTFHLIPYTLS